MKTQRNSMVDHIGTSPFAEVLLWVLVLGLLPADFYNLDVALAGATNGSPLAGHIIAAVLAAGIPMTFALGAACVVRGVKAGRRLLLASGCLIVLVWAVAIVTTYDFRLNHGGSFAASSSGAGVHLSGSATSTPTPVRDASLAALMTLLLVLTSLLGGVLTALREDPEQLLRRRTGRRRLFLQWRHRRVVHRADKARRAESLQRQRIEGLAASLEDVEQQLSSKASRLKHQVRTVFAAHKSDPATTSALMADQTQGVESLSASI